MDLSERRLGLVANGRHMALRLSLLDVSLEALRLPWLRFRLCSCAPISSQV